MSEQIKTKFRGTYGLDAAGNKVINVADADKTILTDGVNVAFLKQENTIQQYDPSRGYDKSFAVIYQDRIWISQVDIVKPAGTFTEAQWRTNRTDPKWIPISSGNRLLKSGEYITVDTSSGLAVELTLPSNALDGDTITIKDVGGRPGFVDVVIKAGIQSILLDNEKLKETKISVPYAQYMFVYVNKLWNLYLTEAYQHATHVDTTLLYEIQSGANVIRQYNSLAPIQIKFPKNANNGDMIHFVGMVSGSIPYYNLELSTFDINTSIISPGTKTTTLKRSLSGYFVFNALTSTWLLYDSDSTNRLRTTNSNTQLFPNETVSVVGANNTDISVINLTLPLNVEPGAQITVALNYMRKGQTVNIIAQAPDVILTNKSLMQFPKRSDYPPTGNWVNTNQLTFNGTSDYPPIITFAYIDNGPIKQWLVVENSPLIERVDPSTDSNRARLGVIALASQAQANLNHENIDSASKEVAITPETLSNRTSTEIRRGIARISTQIENQLASGSTEYLDDVIVTPKKLDQKQATETMRGLAEIATQVEANSITDDVRIITAKKLDGRRATETIAGVAQVVQKTGVAATNRSDAGTGVFNFNDNSKIVTPLVLREFKASETQQGGGFLAMDSEVIAGTPNPVDIPLLVTPVQLHKKTATDARIGFTQTATQVEVNAGTDYFKYVSPKTLNDRVALETRTGISRYATQTEFNSGTGSLITEPSKIKAFLSIPSRTSVIATSGLTQSGNLWTTTTFDIVEPTETQRGTTTLATQVEVDEGTNETKIVTPKTLQGKRTSPTEEGFIRIATNEEVALGINSITAVTPASLSNAVRVDSRWMGSTTVRGTVRMSEGAITFVGTDIVGSTKPLEEYVKDGYAISPYEFNKTLLNYMPLKAKAVDSDKLDGFDSSQFIRRDIDQQVNGNITFTKNTVINGTTTNLGKVILGQLNDGIINTDTVRIAVFPPTQTSVPWNHTLFDTLTDAYYKLQYGNVDIASFKHTGETSLSSLIVNGNTSTNTATVSTRLDVAGTLYVGNKLAITSNSTKILIGAINVETEIRSADANVTKLTDTSGSYSIVTEKNVIAIVDRTFVKKSGDTMGGRLTINAPMTAKIPEDQAIIAPSTTNFGSWVAEISTKAIYDTLPGYVVPVMDIHSITGEPTGFISHYEEFKGPGSISQVGSNFNTGVGAYQMWNPRPLVTTINHHAQTFWMRSWNSVKNQWDAWGRVYTSNNPPTASELGAISDNGNIISSLRIRDYIQVGNLRIYSDPETKTVKFDWIED